jgi:glucosamine--fructose-6-phosphate aminotransferase (isomerizing)
VGGLISETGFAEELSVLKEMKDLGGVTLAVVNTATADVHAAADLVIELSLTAPELARLCVYVVWGQLLGSYYGLSKGLDPDNPRHLSRVVTLSN